MKLKWTYTPNSSNIRAINHDSSNLVLYVKYNSGHTYEYYNVTDKTMSSLTENTSVGKWLNGVIKRNHKYNKVL